MPKDKQELLALISTNIPDNNEKSITPSSMRDTLEQMVDSDANLLELSEQQFSGLVSGLPVGFYTEILRSESTVTQTGAGLDEKVVVELGADSTSAEDEITILSDGTVIALKSGPYYARFSAETARDNNNGIAELFFQSEFSIDGGSTWSAMGRAVNVRLQNADTVMSFSSDAPFVVQAGVRFRTVWCKSSAGGDPSSPTTGNADAKLLYSEPSAALSALGVIPSPSASVVIYKVEGYDYG